MMMSKPKFGRVGAYIGSRHASFRGPVCGRTIHLIDLMILGQSLLQLKG
jgi:hypothetical protein